MLKKQKQILVSDALRALWYAQMDVSQFIK
jgi:hypothetical protein